MNIIILLTLFLINVQCLTKRTPKIRIPSKWYRDLRDVIKQSEEMKNVEEWEGGEMPFADVLHHDRFNLEELLLEQYGLVLEILDVIRLEQAERGENHEELQESIIKRALENVIPYTTQPEREKEIFRRLMELRVYEGL